MDQQSQTDFTNSRTLGTQTGVEGIFVTITPMGDPLKKIVPMKWSSISTGRFISGESTQIPKIITTNRKTQTLEIDIIKEIINLENITIKKEAGEKEKIEPKITIKKEVVDEKKIEKPIVINKEIIKQVYKTKIIKQEKIIIQEEIKQEKIIIQEEIKNEKINIKEEVNEQKKKEETKSILIPIDLLPITRKRRHIPQPLPDLELFYVTDKNIRNWCPGEGKIIRFDMPPPAKPKEIFEKKNSMPNDVNIEKPQIKVSVPLEKIKSIFVICHKKFSLTK